MSRHGIFGSSGSCRNSRLFGSCATDRNILRTGRLSGQLTERAGIAESSIETSPIRDGTTTVLRCDRYGQNGRRSRPDNPRPRLLGEPVQTISAVGLTMNQLAPVIASQAPALVAASGGHASYRFLEFFTAVFAGVCTNSASAAGVRRKWFRFLPPKRWRSIVTNSSLRSLATALARPRPPSLTDLQVSAIGAAT